MKKLKIIRYPNPKLNKVSEDVVEINEDLRYLVSEMFKLMYEDNGVGLAAPQVGVLKRLFILNLQPHEQTPETLAENELVFINPELTDFEGEQELEEGCLSVPGVNAKVKRAMNLTITATNLDGQEFTLEVNDLFARVVQHEYDHIDGILFIRKISPADEIVIASQLNELKQKYQKEKINKKRRIKK